MPARSLRSGKRRSMRRSDREIKDFDEIVKVLEKCDAVRLAFNGEDYPYVVPLSFGMRVQDGRLRLYFHSACEGRKIDLIEKDNRVCFEADCSHRLALDEEQGNCTTEYESVIGVGRISFVYGDEEKTEALRILMKHYGREDFAFNPAVVPRTAVFVLEAESITGKRRIKRAKA